MKAKTTRWTAAAVLVLASAAAAQAPAAQPVAKLADYATAGLARLQFTLADEVPGDQTGFGQAICIDAKNGTFLSLDIPTNIRPEQITGVRLIRPGEFNEGVKGELLGFDRDLGFSFVRATEAHKWKALRFSRTSKLAIGQRVVSMGLMQPNQGNAPYLGMGTVGAKLRVPGHLVYVTGGELTIKSSPVLTTDGRTVGIVADEVPLVSRLKLGQRWLTVATTGRQRSRFFVPVEEFAHVLAEIPTKGNPKRLSWTGILGFLPLSKDEADVKGLSGTPAVQVGQVIPGSPAEVAGIRQSDVIVGLNGKPLEPMATPQLVSANFVRLLQRIKAGAKITLAVRKGSKSKTYTLTTQPMPQRPFEAKRYFNNVLGLIARNMVMLDKYLGRSKPLTERDKGVFLFRVFPRTAAAKGLKPNDLVTHVNNKPVPNVEALKAVLEPVAKPGAVTPITFLVLRGEQTEAVTITPPPKPRSR